MHAWVRTQHAKGMHSIIITVIYYVSTYLTSHDIRNQHHLSLFGAKVKHIFY